MIPTSKRRKKKVTARQTPPTAPTPAPASARHGSRARPWAGWPIAVVGLISFLVGNIGARTGVVALPFDPHHIFAQFGGGLLAIIGLVIATGGS